MCVQVLGIGSTGIRYCVKVRVRDRDMRGMYEKKSLEGECHAWKLLIL